MTESTVTLSLADNVTGTVGETLQSQDYRYASPSWLITTAIATVVVMTTVGVPGNILIVLVYGKKKTQQRAANIFIAALAVVDCFTCGIIIPSLPFIITGKSNYGYTLFWWSSSVAVVMYSVWLLVAIAIDHYQAICQPLSPNMTPRSVKVILSTGLAWSIFMGTLMRVTHLSHVKLIIKIDLFRWMSGLYLLATFLSLAIIYARMFWFLRKRGQVGVSFNVESSQGGISSTEEIYTMSSVLRRTTNTIHPSLGNAEGFSHTSNQIGEQQGRSVIDQNISKAHVSNNQAGESSRRCGNSYSTTNSVKSSTHQQETKREDINIRPLESIFTIANRSNVQLLPEAPTNRQAKQSVTKMAKMLAVVSIVFVLSYIPTYVLPAVLTGNDKFVYVFTHFINHAANPFIYSFMNKRFRRDVSKLFMGRHVHNV